MGRSPCCEKAHTNKGAWTKEGDDRLVSYIRKHGEGYWRSLPKKAARPNTIGSSSSDGKGGRRCHHRDSFSLCFFCYFLMSNITKLEFAPLDISGKNYLSWILDTKLHLSARSLGKTIVENNTESEQDRSKALIFLRHHIHDGLKVEYLNVEDPLILWNSLKERYEHLKNIILPQVRYEWTHLRFQDFKSVSAYNSAIFRITSMMKLCAEKNTDEEMLEKTLSTFHASNVLLQQQYRERGFAKYSELISCLLLAEQHREILMKNHEQRPTGSAPLPEVSGNAFPEANAIVLHGQNNPRGRGRGPRNGRRRGQGHGPNNDLGHVDSNISKRGANRHNRGRNNGIRPSNAPVVATRDHAPNGNVCHRCGTSGHWFRTCRTPRHLVDLYTAFQKGKLESNLIEFDAPLKDFNVDDLFSTRTDFDAVAEDTQDF